MRIIGGKYKRRIFTPGKKFTARPTTDQAKEGLFNILENRYDFASKNILDLFSGTGSIGYEFISRGAKQVTFVDQNNSHVRFIKKITGELNIQNSLILRQDVFRFLKQGKDTFDIIFADPPFGLEGLEKIPEAVFNSGVLKEDGLLILEHPGEYDFSSFPHFREIRKYGKVNFSFFF